MAKLVTRLDRAVGVPQVAQFAEGRAVRVVGGAAAASTARAFTVARAERDATRELLRACVCFPLMSGLVALVRGAGSAVGLVA